MMRWLSLMDVPGLAFMLIITVPVSSSGISPVFVVRIRNASSRMEAKIVLHISHFRLTKKSTERMYRSVRTSNDALNALRNRAAKLAFVFPFSSLYGRSISAQSAGESVKALTAEMPTATAIVIPNCL